LVVVVSVVIIVIVKAVRVALFVAIVARHILGVPLGGGAHRRRHGDRGRDQGGGDDGDGGGLEGTHGGEQKRALGKAGMWPWKDGGAEGGHRSAGRVKQESG